MKSIPSHKIIAALAALVLTAVAAQAQLFVNVSEQATFGPFVGGVNNGVTNNGATNAVEVVTTGSPTFDITYTPIFGPSGPITLLTGTLDVATLTWRSGTTPLNLFNTLAFNLKIDFDNNGSVDVETTYTLGLTPFSQNGFTGVSYEIIPIVFSGNTTINGTPYSYAGVVANATGNLFDGTSTTSVVQFQFDTAERDQIDAVPEPSTYGVIGAGALFGLMAFRRIRRKANVLAV
jgi:PEP-CTERM motif